MKFLQGLLPVTQCNPIVLLGVGIEIIAKAQVYNMPGWQEATAVQKLSSNTYAATLHDDWCIGSGKLPRLHDWTLYYAFAACQM